MRPQRPSEVLDRAKTKAFLVSNLTNIVYLTDVQVSAGFVLVRGKSMVLLVDGRYREAAKKAVRKGVAVRPIDDLKGLLRSIPQCGFEASNVTVARLRNWKRNFKNTKFVQSNDIIEEFRRSKEPDEIKKFRKARLITQKIIKRVPSALKGSLTEKQLAEKLRQWAVELGAEELSFDPIVAFGTHTSRPHHHPTDRKFKKGDIVQIDVGAKYQGYCADQSAVFFTGKKTPKQERVLRAVERAKEEAIAAVAPDVTNHKLDAIARNILKEEGFEQYFVHSLGHGVGLEIHEGISLSQKAPKMKLQKGEIITIEPGVYIPGQFGIRLEEEIVV